MFSDLAVLMFSCVLINNIHGDTELPGWSLCDVPNVVKIAAVPSLAFARLALFIPARLAHAGKWWVVREVETKDQARELFSDLVQALAERAT